MILGPRPSDQRIIHAGHEKQREYWDFALRQVPIPAKRLQRYNDCGKRAWVYYSQARERYKVKHESCGLRICPLCATRYQMRTRKRIAALFYRTPLPRLKFITLTLRSIPIPLKDQLSRLKDAFRRLRQRKIWRKVKWGAAVIEMTRNTKTKQWHPHLHILADSTYIPQSELREAWRSITEDSFVVDIRKVVDRKAVLNEIAKYASKPTAFSQISDSVGAGTELYEATVGRRLLLLFGQWPDIPEEKPEDDGLEDDWKAVKPLYEILLLASQGDSSAQATLQACDIEPNTLKRWKDSLKPP